MSSFTLGFPSKTVETQLTLTFITNSSLKTDSGLNPHAMKHAVIFGSLGMGNVGDDELLLTLLRDLESNYFSASIVLSRMDQSLINKCHDQSKLKLSFHKSPKWPGYYRKWIGYIERLRLKRSILSNSNDSNTDAYWLGGLFGRAWQNNRIRYLELEWASRFADNLIYYFGDFSEGFRSAKYAQSWCDLAAKKGMIIAVRSAGAKEELCQLYRNSILQGIDIVLHDRLKTRELFSDSWKNSRYVVINPCNNHFAAWQMHYLSAGRYFAKHGYNIKWVSTCDPEDYDKCILLSERLGNEFRNVNQELVSAVNAEQVISQARYTIAGRYHAAIFSITNCVPVISIPYDIKLQRLHSFLGIESYLFSQNKNEIETISDLHEQCTAIESGEYHVNNALADGVQQHEVSKNTIQSLLHHDCPKR